ncbi:MAG: hypothetical protein LBB56_07635 [Chitinispirillales bacterium]|jgi:hypothetical protein|nr:hypothetical protein [Chitinispirillales bacterium]
MKKRTDTVLRVEATKVLINALGVVDAERFIAMIKRDTFDYTEWQRDLWKDKTIDEIHQMASEFETKSKNTD